MISETCLGGFLKSVRRDQGYTIDELSKRSGYSAGYISNIEAGRRMPNPFALRCILESMKLGVDVRDSAALLLLKKESKC